MKNKNFLVLFLFIFLTTSHSVFADATTTPICTSLNSLLPYNKVNVTNIQTFLHDKYFSNVKVTGLWDLQTKKYIKKFQFSYALNETGKLSDETLDLLRSVAHCYVIERGILNYLQKNASTSQATSTATSTNIFIRARALVRSGITQEDIVANLIKTFNIDITIPKIKSVEAKPTPQLKLVILDSSNTKYKYIHDSISNNSQVQDLINRINNKINWTSDIKVTFEDCNTPTAYFDSTNTNIVMCYEYIDFFVQNNSQNISTNEKINQAVNFNFLHQIGHALVYIFNLPTTGNEETAMDEFAMYFLLNFASPEELNSAISNIKQFYYLSINQNLKTEYLANIHAPGIDRYYNLLAFYLGAHPDQNSYYVGNEAWQLSDDKSTNISADYSKKIKTWTQLLSGHTK